MNNRDKSIWLPTPEGLPPETPQPFRMIEAFTVDDIEDFEDDEDE